MIVNDDSRVIRMPIQAVESPMFIILMTIEVPTIVVLMTLDVPFMLLENIYSTCITYDHYS
jgi:hypothetical protein